MGAPVEDVVISAAFNVRVELRIVDPALVFEVLPNAPDEAPDFPLGYLR
jgi:hypothetical protein